jgi:hypothetical protein
MTYLIVGIACVVAWVNRQRIYDWAYEMWKDDQRE